METYLGLIALGLSVGAIGTLIGAGGGFVLVPVLLLLYPRAAPETITCVSLAVVCCNALSGSWAYMRLGRIDYRSGLLFASATIPGAILGALTTDCLPRREFDGVFGILLLAAASYLLLWRHAEKTTCALPAPHYSRRQIIERNGSQHVFSYNPKLGLSLSLVIGYISSLLGIGGGIIHVPVLVRLLNFPVHIATATSHFVLAIMAFTGTSVHIWRGAFSRTSAYQTLFLSVGVILGAQIGAWLSGRVRGAWIIRGLAIALGLVGLRILIMAMHA